MPACEVGPGCTNPFHVCKQCDGWTGGGDHPFACKKLREAIDALEGVKCSACAGLGVRSTACTLCGDSTYDHVCNDHDVTCAMCNGARQPAGVIRALGILRMSIGYDL